MTRGRRLRLLPHERWLLPTLERNQARRSHDDRAVQIRASYGPLGSRMLAPALTSMLVGHAL